MAAQDTIARLDASLERAGTDIKIFRAASFVECRARVRGLSAQELRPGSTSGQGAFRAILSPTDFAGGAVPLPLKVTDKVLWNGSQRSITYVWPVIMDGQVVRIEADFMG
ncbi:hypothetical protein [Azospirillum sp. TSO5]|uniref:hypothetical protein n=1 Tax=Azospirillum sp. TSO5 TaxID=716760 RepID=UPI000D6100A3|nr:hypothetical protein [Azospirillum sp. TSO5]PWC96964.1 hypothetical protein TSO5_05905 [Azospirillum sp. TSO5]